MSEYLKRVMLPDEEIIYETEIHWIVYAKGVLILLLGVLVGHWGNMTAHYLMGRDAAATIDVVVERFALGIIALGAVQMLWAFIRQISTELVITNRRVVAKYGFIATTTFELLMNKVEGANIDQSVLGRILGYGTVMVKGTGGGSSPIDHIANPTGFQSYLLVTLEQAQQPHPPDAATVLDSMKTMAAR